MEDSIQSLKETEAQVDDCLGRVLCADDASQPQLLCINFSAPHLDQAVSIGTIDKDAEIVGGLSGSCIQAAGLHTTSTKVHRTRIERIEILTCRMINIPEHTWEQEVRTIKAIRQSRRYAQNPTLFTLHTQQCSCALHQGRSGEMESVQSSEKNVILSRSTLRLDNFVAQLTASLQS